MRLMEEKSMTPDNGIDGFTLATQSFLLDCTARGLSQQTVTFYANKLKVIIREFTQQGITTPQDMTPDNIRTLLVKLQATHNSGGVHTFYRTLRTFINYLVSEGELTHSPLARVHPPKLAQEIIEPVSVEHVSALLSVCHGSYADRDRAMILTLLDSGLRAQELLNLRLQDVDVATGRVVVRHGKGNKDRIVYLGANTRKAILKYLKVRRGDTETDRLWLADDGRPLGYWGLFNILRRKAKAAGIPTPSPHDFRRAFALLSLRRHVDLITLQRLMGHSSLIILHRYLAIVDDDLKRAHQETSPVDYYLKGGRHAR